MRKLLFLLALTVTLAVLSPTAIASLQKIIRDANPCTQPIAYRIETVDNRFGISRDKLLQNLQKAEAVWETPVRRDLFVYDPQGDLSVNMVYDDRQSKSSQINKLENQLEQNEKNLKPQMAEYEKRSAQFNQKVEKLNQEIAKWNAQGGAPPDEYARLTKDQEALKKEAEELNAMAQNLNLSADQFNTSVVDLNQQIGSFNNELVTRPEEGLYLASENKIEIYFYVSDKELIHTLAHELGHALGMQHVDNKKAIMYQQTTEAIVPSQDDLEALKAVCKISES